MSLLKVTLLLSSAVLFDMGLDLSAPLQPGAKVVVTATTREGIWQHAAPTTVLFLKGMTYITAAAESMVILGSLRTTPPSSGAMSAFLHALGPTGASQLTVPFILGAFLVIAGGIIRRISFRALGPYFTFVQCIQKDHKLITTGPYAVVRHPGYAALFMCIVGSAIMHGSSGSWLRMSGFMDVLWVRVAVACWCLIMGASVMTLFSRTAEEDQFLSERFGKEWDAWARRVRYKWVPFVY